MLNLKRILADSTARSTISYWHDNVVCMYVHQSVRDTHPVSLLWLNDTSYTAKVSEQVNRKRSPRKEHKFTNLKVYRV